MSVLEAEAGSPVITLSLYKRIVLVLLPLLFSIAPLIISALLYSKHTSYPFFTFNLQFINATEVWTNTTASSDVPRYLSVYNTYLLPYYDVNLWGYCGVAQGSYVVSSDTRFPSCESVDTPENDPFSLDHLILMESPCLDYNDSSICTSYYNLPHSDDEDGVWVDNMKSLLTAILAMQAVALVFWLASVLLVKIVTFRPTGLPLLGLAALSEITVFALSAAFLAMAHSRVNKISKGYADTYDTYGIEIQKKSEPIAMMGVSILFGVLSFLTGLCVVWYAYKQPGVPEPQPSIPLQDMPQYHASDPELPNYQANDGENPPRYVRYTWTHAEREQVNGW